MNRLRSLSRQGSIGTRRRVHRARRKSSNKTPLSVAASVSPPRMKMRRRGLETLIQTIKKKTPKKAKTNWLGFADSGTQRHRTRVRGEAFKCSTQPEDCRRRTGYACVSRSSRITGCAARSTSPKLHAQEKEPWGRVPYEFFNDPDPGLRKRSVRVRHEEEQGNRRTGNRTGCHALS